MKKSTTYGTERKSGGSDSEISCQKLTRHRQRRKKRKRRVHHPGDQTNPQKPQKKKTRSKHGEASRGLNGKREKIELTRYKGKKRERTK